jgi:DNA-binding MarR family transcriptional regulator
LADRLVRDGLAERVADPADRRAVLLSASRKGQRTAERVKAWRLAELARRYGALSTADRRALQPTVRRLGDVLQPTPQPPERSTR